MLLKGENIPSSEGFPGQEDSSVEERQVSAEPHALIFSLWNAFSFSHKGTFLRWIRRCTANMRLAWAHSRLSGLRRQWTAGSSEFTAFSLHPRKQLLKCPMS